MNSFNSLIHQYNRVNTPIAFDFRYEMNRKHENTNDSISPTQYIHYYPGRILPYIPQYFFRAEELRDLNGYVLDPFAGSGTILFEAINNPHSQRSAWGVEINPLGRIISKVKTTILNMEELDHWFENIIAKYERGRERFEHFLPDLPNISFWFSRKAIKRLSKLRHSIALVDMSANYRDFFWLCFSNIVRMVSMADPYIPPPVLLKLNKYKNSLVKYKILKKHLITAEDPDVMALFRKVVEERRGKLALSRGGNTMYGNACSANIIWDDVREIRMGRISDCGRIEKKFARLLPDDSVDIIMTSPPYLTAQKYIRSSRLELAWLGYGYAEISKMEKESVGTEKISLSSDIQYLGIRAIDDLLSYALRKSKERYFTVLKYFKDMQVAFAQMSRVLKRGGCAILVVGDNRVINKRVKTYLLLSHIAQLASFKLLFILKDSIKSRTIMTKRSITGGLIKNEYILVLKKR